MIRSICLVALAAIACSAPAAATLRTFDFKARVDNSTGVLPVGATLSGSFSYDDALTPTLTFENIGGMSAEYHEPSVQITVSFAGQTFGGEGFAGVTNDSEGEDSLFVYRPSADNFIGFTFYDPSGAAFNSTTLPPGPFPALNPGPFDGPDGSDDVNDPFGEFDFYDSVAGQGFFATVTSITPSGAIPEPASWALMILGFGIAGSAVRRRVALNQATAGRV